MAGILVFCNLTALEELEPIDENYTCISQKKVVFGRFGKSTAENSYTPRR